MTTYDTAESQVIQPGRSSIEAGRALLDPRRLAGRWPYQWLFPGPNSKMVLANATVLLPTSGEANILTYQVPDGYRFSLRGISFTFYGTGWNPGTATGLAFTLQVLAAGTRNVEFLANVQRQLGSDAQPYPILGRLEFAPLDQLVVVIFNGGGVPGGGGSTNRVGAVLAGHTYPNAEMVG